MTTTLSRRRGAGASAGDGDGSGNGSGTGRLGEQRDGRGGRNGGRAPARRAVVRWAWRLFRREWRQQLLVLALLTVAVTATAVGTAVATNTVVDPQTTVTLPGSDPQLAADIAAFQQHFGPVEVLAHRSVDIPGSVSTIDVRALEAATGGTGATAAAGGGGATGRLRLLQGRLPSGSGEVAVTHGVAGIFDLRLGATWVENGRTLQVVGLVENPRDLQDQFALLAPGQADPPTTVTLRLSQSVRRLGFRFPSGTPASVAGVAGAKSAAAAAVLGLATIFLLFIGLVAVAGFTVMAQRRQRALGMLAAIGATERQVRMVMLANGAVVGATSALVGMAAGVAGWLAFAPRLETLAGHRIDRFALPWWALGTAVGLAVVTAVVAAWWPARAAARIPVVAALSGRPPRPRPAHRFAAAGGVLLVAGIALLTEAHQRRALLIVAGTVAITLGVLFVAPLAIRALGVVGRRAPIAVRLALRDLARYQARSGAALGAITLAVGIAATIAISAGVYTAGAGAAAVGAIPDNQLNVYLSQEGKGGPVPDLTDAQMTALQARVDGIAARLHTDNTVTVDAAVDPSQQDVSFPDGSNGKIPVALVQVTPRQGGFDESFVSDVYVATPSVLAHYGIAASQVDPGADLLTSQRGLSGLQLGSGRGSALAHPTIQYFHRASSAAPFALITTHAIETLGSQPRIAGWIIRTPRPLTASQIDAARRQAAAGGLVVSGPPTHQSQVRLAREATATGIVLALGVLAMTVGLIRSETARDLRTLAATGAGGGTRRTITSATAGALALLGGVLGTAGAYVALLTWYHRDMDALNNVPVANLLVILAGLPLVAAAGGWLLAGREPPAMGRQPLE